jgi:two-component system sensor histidine kinase DesK
MTDTVNVMARIRWINRENLGGALWAAIWMWPLLDPLSSLLNGDSHPVLPGLLGLSAFVLLYVVVVVRGFGNHNPRASRGQLGALAVLAALALILVLGYTSQAQGWLALPLYVGAAGAATLQMPGAFGWVAGATAVAVTVGVTNHVNGSVLGSDIFGMVLGCLLVIVVKRMIGYIHQLHAAQAELARSAVAEERLRFSRDLHELLGHTLTLIVVKAQVARRLMEAQPVAAAAAAADIEQIGRKALVEVREAVTGYREAAFATELDGARAALCDAGIEVSITEVGTPLPSPADTLFGWAVREAATNVIRHSGARHCTIVVRHNGAQSTLEVRDDGAGGARSGVSPGNGLRGLRERLASAGGSLRAANATGGGFELRASLPATGAMA